MLIARMALIKRKFHYLNLRGGIIGKFPYVFMNQFGQTVGSFHRLYYLKKLRK